MFFPVKKIKLVKTLVVSLIIPLFLFSCDVEETLNSLTNTKKRTCFFSSFDFIPIDSPKPSIAEVFRESNWKEEICKCFSCPSRFVIILVDKTVSFSSSFSLKVATQITNSINPGDVVEVINFSSYKGSYTNVYSQMFFEPPLDKLEDCIKIKHLYFIKEHHLTRFIKQKNFFKELLKEDIEKNSPSIPKTQILLTLAEISEIINDIKNECSNSRIVLIIISDMLENGDAISFYSKGGIYIPANFQPLLDRIKKEKLLANLKDVDVYILGLGYLKNRTIPEKQLIRLKAFWKSYFENTQADIAGIGAPLYPFSIK